MNLCFYKRNQSGKHLQVTFYIFSNRNCISTEKIYFVFWKLKSNKFICICVLIAKIQQIDLNFGFGVKIQTNWFEFVFWHKKSIWSTFTGYFLYFLKSNLLFDRKNPENWFQFVFWQVKSNEPKRTNLVSMTFPIYLIFNLILTKIESKLVSYFFSSDINTLTILCGVLNWHKNCEL